MSAYFKLEIKSDSAAFAEDPHEEVARILRELARSIAHGAERTKVYDVNGNRCGTVTMKFETEEE